MTNDSLLFVTGNHEKLLQAQHVCAVYNISLEHKNIAIDEIQSEDSEQVAVKKAMAAFTQVNQPVIISDDSWHYHGFNGFPGAYMHSMNVWFTPQNFAALHRIAENKQVTQTKYLVYQDADQTKIWRTKLPGKLLEKPAGKSDHPSHTVIAMDHDDGLSIAQAITKFSNAPETRKSAEIWHQLAKWHLGLQKQKTS